MHKLFASYIVKYSYIIIILIDLRWSNAHIIIRMNIEGILSFIWTEYIFQINLNVLVVTVQSDRIYVMLIKYSMIYVMHIEYLPT